MRTYMVEIDGIARVMRLYNDASSPEAEIAKWPQTIRDKAGAVVEIKDDDIPKGSKEKWRIKDGKIEVAP